MLDLQSLLEFQIMRPYCGTVSIPVCYNKEKLIVWSNPQICLSQCFGKNQFQSLPY